jgi:hypothetical protein
MKAALSFNIRRMGFFGRVKQTKINGLVGHLDFGSPLAVFFANARKAAFVLASFLVVCVLSVRHFPQIVERVVRPVSVYVVNLFRWPPAVNVQPCQPMRQIQPVIYANEDVAVARYAASTVAFSAFSPADCPRKHTRIRVVFRKFAEAIRRKIGLHSYVNITAWRGGQA